MDFPVDELAAEVTGPCLFSTLYVCQVDPATGEVVDALYDKAGKYCEAISQAVRNFHTDEYPTNDLMRYFVLPDDPGMEAAVREKVRAARVGVAAVGEVLYAKLELDLAADLTPDEMDAFTEQIGSQYRDGWGAQFEILDIPSGEEGVAVRFWQDSIKFCTELASTRSQHQPVAEINKDTFWALIGQAKEHPGGPSEWLMEQLMGLGPEQAKRFDTMVRVYMDLAYQYGLWSAASVMEQYGCSDDGFIDFRGWLVGQGKEVYMAAMADPDSLASAADYQDQLFGFQPSVGDCAYEELTGRDAYQDFDPAEYQALKAELARDVVYGEGINYPYDLADIPAYVPQLCAKYLTQKEIKDLAQSRHCTWNLTDPDILAARRGPKSSRVTGKVQGGGVSMSDSGYTLKLYTSICVNVEDTVPGYDGGTRLPDPDDWMDGRERKRFKAYHSAVLKAVTEDPPVRDMTSVFKSDLQDKPLFREMAGKIKSMVYTVEDVDGKFFGVIVCQLKGQLDTVDINTLKEYCRFLCSKNPEIKRYHSPLNKYHDHLDIHIWQDKISFMLTEQEMERAPWRKPRQKNKGGEAR